MAAKRPTKKPTLQATIKRDLIDYFGIAKGDAGKFARRAALVAKKAKKKG